MWFKLKRFILNVWKVLTILSYLIIFNAVCLRIENSSSNHRITLRLYSLGLFTMYMRFLQCMIVHSYFGPKIIMIGEMVSVYSLYSIILQLNRKKMHDIQLDDKKYELNLISFLNRQGLK